jgi:hypothetical protein
MAQEQTVAIFLVRVSCLNAYQATNFFSIKTQLLTADCCYATEVRLLRGEAQKLKPVISDSHYVLSRFP